MEKLSPSRKVIREWVKENSFDYSINETPPLSYDLSELNNYSNIVSEWWFGSYSIWWKKLET